MDHALHKLRLHFFYCSVILTLVIIAIATDRWTLQPKFTEFLSNAATMTSLVLGLVAIFYSFIANDGLSKSLGSIGAVSDEVKASRDQIVNQVNLSTQTTKSAQRSAELIEGASSSISANLATLSATLSAISTHTEFLHGSLGDLPTRLDQLETKLIDATKSLGIKPVTPASTTTSKSIDPVIVKTFLSTSSLAANTLAYACVLAYQTGKPLNIPEFCRATGSKLENYLNGFLACMDAVQLADIFPVDGAIRTYTITGIHDSLVKDTREYIFGFIERQYKDKNTQVYERWKNAMVQLETLYGQ
ncbi:MULTISPECIES: hypothetical protein [unclassified Roseateles]|uniref:hypothetical protein n=1 Tax=unclassified Roseateles TaxID=2626991 RepID=UPI000A66573B|nr:MULTISPECIES: hypothetical protein [unclassified Roseateles]